MQNKCFWIQALVTRTLVHIYWAKVRFTVSPGGAVEKVLCAPL
jgi:hypothetical protein